MAASISLLIFIAEISSCLKKNAPFNTPEKYVKRKLHRISIGFATLLIIQFNAIFLTKGLLYFKFNAHTSRKNSNTILEKFGGYNGSSSQD